MRIATLFIRADVVVALLGMLALGETARAQPDVDLLAHPVSAPRGISGLDVTIQGTGLGIANAVKFLVTGTEVAGGVAVTRIVNTNSATLIATVTVDPGALIGDYDVDVRSTDGDTVRGERVFSVTDNPVAWSFGCTGAEAWRRRIPCKRGTIY